MSQIKQEAQKLSPSAIISLFTLDARALGGPILNFTMSSQMDASVSFGGVVYQPVDFDFQGLETSGVGALPQPKIRLSNGTSTVQAIVATYGDLNGAEVTRIRTYARFLDGQPEADSTAFYGPDRYRVERKSSDAPTFVEWELSAAIDQEGKMIPGRVVIASTCMWRYRSWNTTTGAFDYSKAQCPYTGAQAYDINDLPVASALDRPSRKISCCKKRFGSNSPLPFGGFPGASRLF